MTRKKADRYPPYLYLCYVGDHLSETLKTYLFLWRWIDSDLRFYTTSDEIKNTYNMSWAIFLNDIRKLAFGDLLEYAWVDDVLVVTLADAPEDI